MEMLRQFTDMNLQDAIGVAVGATLSLLGRAIVDWIRKPRQLSEVAMGILTKIEQAEDPRYHYESDKLVAGDVTIYISGKVGTVYVTDIGDVTDLLTSSEVKRIRKTAIKVKENLLATQMEEQRRKAVESLGVSFRGGNR